MSVVHNLCLTNTEVLDVLQDFMEGELVRENVQLQNVVHLLKKHVSYLQDEVNYLEESCELLGTRFNRSNGFNQIE
jgi:hypothetical protein